MSQLTPIRAGLARLRRRRRLVRRGTALVAVLSAAAAALAAAFAVDWLFDATRPQRVILILLGVGAVVWAYRRFARPQLAVRETDVDMALLVGKSQELDCDLVAALQFEEPAAGAWGSAPLRQAVVEYVAEFGKGLNVFEGFSARGLVRRAAVLGVALIAGGLFAATHGPHVRAFLDRLALGSARYPTRTVLDRVVVNGHPVDPAGGAVVRCPQGAPVHVAVTASGELPETGQVVVRPRGGRSDTPVSLTRAADAADYEAHLPEPVDDLDLEVVLGDARAGPIRVELLPLPVIEVAALVTAPDYARVAASGASAPQNARRLSVPEGSRVDLRVTCGNKSLTAVVLTAAGVSYPLTPAGAGREWELAGDKSPLAVVGQSVQYEIQVTDEDGLHLPKPFEGAVHILPDQRPQVAGGTLTRFVLPAARPAVQYRVVDDHGIAGLAAHLEVTHPDGRSEARRTVPVRVPETPLPRGRLPLKGAFPLDLAPLGLAKGDRLSVILEAVDYRGPLAGQPGTSDPIVFEVTDEAGILEDIARPDYQSAEELDAIIRQQLNIGGAK